MADRSRKKADKKIVIIGDPDVGKTCLIHRYIEGTFLEGSNSTIGAAFFLKHWESLNFAIWDTAGEERFSGLSSFYCRGANAVILCYDVCDARTYDALDARHTRLLDVVADNCIMVLVGTKIDLVNKSHDGKVKKREVSTDAAVHKALEYTERWSSLKHPSGTLPIFETSSKTGEKVNNVFEYIFQTIAPSSAPQRSTTPTGLIELLETRSGEFSSKHSKGGKSCC